MLETLQGLELSDNPGLVSCLRLQHEHHLRQVKVLQGKQLRQSSIEARKGRPVKMRSKSVQTESLNSLPHRAAGVRHQNVLVNTQVRIGIEPMWICVCMTECFLSKMWMVAHYDQVKDCEPQIHIFLSCFDHMWLMHHLHPCHPLHPKDSARLAYAVFLLVKFCLDGKNERCW